MGSYIDRIKEYLDDEGVNYEVLHHPVAYTAQQVAGAQHIPGRKMVKAVVVNADGKYIMCVLPAIHLINFSQLKEALHAHDVRLAREEEVANLFPDCAVGSEPPFAKWYDNMELYYDTALDDCNRIVFNAGTHTDTIQMSWSDYKRLMQPKPIECWVHI